MSKGIMLMEINQPIGSFYIGKINSADLIKIQKLSHRKNNIGNSERITRNESKGNRKIL